MTDKYSEFDSLEEHNKFIKKYEQENYIQLWKIDCRTIKRMQSVCPKKLINYNLELQYYSLNYACSKGGKKFKSKSTGVRRSATFKENCSMQLKVVISEDGQKLKVVNIDDKQVYQVSSGILDFENNDNVLQSATMGRLKIFHNPLEKGLRFSRRIFNKISYAV